MYVTADKNVKCIYLYMQCPTAVHCRFATPRAWLRARRLASSHCTISYAHSSLASTMSLLDNLFPAVLFILRLCSFAFFALICLNYLRTYL